MAKKEQNEMAKKAQHLASFSLNQSSKITKSITLASKTRAKTIFRWNKKMNQKTTLLRSQKL